MKKIEVDLPVGRVELILNDVTIVGGINGSGKTLLLEAIVERARKEGVPCLYIPALEAYKYNFSDNAVDACQKNFKYFDKKPPEHYGMGERFLLGMIQKVLDFSSNNEAGGMIVIDLPETGLHPGWQRKLVDIIRKLSGKKQLAIATHAPSIIQEGWISATRDMSEILYEEV